MYYNMQYNKVMEYTLAFMTKNNVLFSPLTVIAGTLFYFVKREMKKESTNFLFHKSVKENIFLICLRSIIWESLQKSLIVH